MALLDEAKALISKYEEGVQDAEDIILAEFLRSALIAFRSIKHNYDAIREADLEAISAIKETHA